MIAELLQAEDVALSLIEQLRARAPKDVLIGQGVSPNPRRDRMIMIMVDYGRRTNVAQQSATVRVNCWDRSHYDAMRLAHWCSAELLRLQNGLPVQRADNQYGPIEVADESEQDRVYFTVDILFRVRNVEK